MDYSTTSGGWQILEERIDDDNDANPGTNRHLQYLWGPRYIDDILCRRQDSDLDGDYLDSPGGDYWYHCTDVQFSTVAILDDTAKLRERISYDPYGVARHHRYGDLDGDGDNDAVSPQNCPAPTTDFELLYCNWGNFGVGDLNRDGGVDVDDLLDILSAQGAALPLGDLSHPWTGTAGVDNLVGWDGYLHAAFTFQWHVRFRGYEPRLGRWMARDPLQYVGGANLYQYVRAKPIGPMDPLGLQDTGYTRYLDRKFARPWTDADGDEGDPVDEPLTPAQTAALKLLQKILSWGCFAQCYLLDMTNEDLASMFRDVLDGEIPDELKDRIVEEVLKALAGEAAAPIVSYAQLVNIVRAVLGEGLTGAALDKLLRWVDEELLDALESRLRPKLTRIVGKGARKLGGQFTKFVPGIGWVMFGIDCVEVATCIAACQDGQFTDSDRPSGIPEHMPAPAVPTPAELQPGYDGPPVPSDYRDSSVDVLNKMGQCCRPTRHH